MECHFNLYIVTYPGEILLPLGEEIEFQHEEKLVIAKLLKIKKPITVKDFTNEITDNIELKYKIDAKSKKTVSEGFTIAINETLSELNIIENQSYSQLEFRFSCSSHDSKEKYNNIRSVTKTFINTYRNSVGDPTIPLEYDNNSKNILIHEYTRKYLDDERSLTEKQRLKSIMNHGFLKQNLKFLTYGTFTNNFNHSSIDKEENLSQIKKGFSKEIPSLIENDILLKAHEEHLLNKNYKYAFLDAFIFIEQLIVKFVDTKCSSKNISNTKIKKHEKDIGISYLIDIVLPLLFNGLKKNEKEILDKVSNLNSKRNKIVHKAETVNEEESTQIIEIAYSLSELLTNKNDD